MGVPNTVQTADFALKQGYYGRAIQEVAERDFPLLAMLNKKPATGNPHKIPTILSDGAGVSSDFATAQSSAQGISGQPFLVQLADFFGVVPLNQKMLLTAEKEAGTFIDWLMKENDAKIRGIKRHISTLLFGNGGGAIGQIASFASNVITLSSQNTALNFWVGQQLVASANDGSLVGHALRAGTFMTVTAVDRDLGTVTVDNTGLITGLANGDSIFLRGSFAGNVTQTLIFKGLAAWLTSAAPTDTLWGVARTGRPELAGFRAPSGDQVGPAIQRVRKLAIHGFTMFQSAPRLCVVHPKQWEQMSISLAANGYRELRSSTGMTGFKTLSLMTTYGEVDIMSDAHCDPLRAYLLDLDSISIPYLDSDLITPIERDGLRMVPAANDAGFEVRYTAFCNLEMDAPWRSGSIPLAVV